MSRPLSEHGSDVRDRTLLHNSSHNNLIRRRALQHKIDKTLTMVKRNNMEEEEDWSVEKRKSDITMVILKFKVIFLGTCLFVYSCGVPHDY